MTAFKQKHKEISMSKITFHYNFPKIYSGFKSIEINFLDQKIVSTRFLKKIFPKKSKPKIKNIDQIIKWLDSYFSHKNLKNLPFSYFNLGEMSEFNQNVLKEIHKITFGKNKTYSDIALKIKKPKAFRAVGTACGKNPIILFIPCHRVLGKSGLGGFSYGLKLKETLLELENQN